MADSPNVQLYITSEQTPSRGHNQIDHSRDSPDETHRSENCHGAEIFLTTPITLIQDSNPSLDPSHSNAGPLGNFGDQSRPSSANRNSEKCGFPRGGPDVEKQIQKVDEIDTPLEGSDTSSACGTGGKVEEPSASNRIKYMLSYTDGRECFKDEVVDNMESLEPALDQLKLQEEAILEVTRIIYVERMHIDHTISLAQQNVKISEYGPCLLKIKSTAIIQALASVVDYWPGLNLNSPSLTVKEPFAVLYHHKKALQDYVRADMSVPGHSESRRCQRIINASRHIKLLLEFLDARPEAKKIQLERERYNRSRPVATFEMLWMLFAPGTDVFHDFLGLGSFESGVVKQVTGGGLDVGSASPFTLTFWYLRFNGHWMGREEYMTPIEPFKGEKEISSLNIIPCEFYERDIAGQVSDKSKALRQKLENYGETFLRLTKRHYVYYSGRLAQSMHRSYSGRVMVDAEGYYHKFPNFKPALYPLVDDVIIPPPACICSHCNSNGQVNDSSESGSQFSEYDQIDPEGVEFRGLTPHQKFVCAPQVYAFALNIREWLRLQIKDIEECRWNTSMIDRQLSLDNGARDIIKGLVQRNIPGLGLKNCSNKKWRADFITDKGDSQIFLLHGPPGVGKTFTAECVAEFVQRPLLSLNCSDIGIDIDHVERSLQKYFKMADLWDAVVLLDEADVYLEQRTAQDLQRNCIVAAFLRSLECFKGILFLTTNRVGPFDDALLSRVHIILHYDFDEFKRQAVWDIFFQKLERERSRYIKVPYSTREYTRHDSELRMLNWNGREIRNAFQTAVALAEHRNECDPEDGLILLRDEHFKQVVQMSAKFIGYMKRVRGSEAEKHAAMRGDRNESYK